MIVAETTEEVGISFVDFFTWGHLFMGMIAFILGSLLHILLRYVIDSQEKIANDFKDDPFPIYWSLVITIAFAIFWEVFENIVLWNLGLKFEGRQDSPINIFSDILFVSLAGLLYLIIWYLLVEPGSMKAAYKIYLIYTIGVIIVVIAYFIGRAMIP